MGIIRNLITSAQDYFADREEEKGLTSLDLKAVPMFNEGGSSSNYVQTWSSMAAWDRAIESAFNGWNGSKINYANEVGDLRFSVLIMAAVRWAGINLGTGRMQVVELDADEKETDLQDHPFVALMKQPNPEATSKTMWKQFGCSRVIAGECYFLKGRDASGRVKELWYEPHTTIAPRWDRNLFPEDETANEFIQYFEIRRGGRWIPVRKMDVFRVYDLLDPITRRGTNGVDALMRTIFTDNERETYQGLLMKNFGVTPKAVGPKNAGVKIDAPALSNSLQRKWSGDERGKPTVFTEPMEVLDFSTDFSADAMEKLAHISESRVAAALGISVQSLKFGVSQQSSTYNNVREFRREDYEQWVMPTHEDFLAAAENQLLRDMDTNERHVLRFDYSRVPIIQRDKMETAKETEILVRTQTIKQSEARERHSYEHENPEYDRFLVIPARAELAEKPEGDDDDEPTKAAKLPKIKKSELDESADFWREHPALDDDAKDLIDAVPYTNGKVS